MNSVFRYLLALPLVVGCSSPSHSTPDDVTDAGTADSATAIARATVRGLIVDYDTKHPMAGLSVTEGDATTTTDAQGLWSLSVATGIPMYPVISGNPKYVKLNLPENIITGDFDHGRVLLPTLTTFHLGTSALPGYDSTRGIIYVTATTLPTCPSLAGGTLVDTPSGSDFRYFKYGLPSTTATGFADREDPVGAVYDAPPGDDTLLITHPTCKVPTFPYVNGGRTLTGRVHVEGGDVNSAMDFYLW